MRALALAAFALIAVSAAGCTKDEVLARDVEGTVKSPQGAAIDAVVMMDPNSGASTEGSVDGAGNFAMTVYGTGVVRIVFKAQGEPIGVVQFDNGYGGTTTLFPITDEPEPDASAKNGPSGDDAPSVQYVYARTSIDLGELLQVEGTSLYVPSRNPLAHVDTDGDGIADLADEDDDADGQADASDADANGNQIDDIYETDDQDKDGVPDEIQASNDSP